jgi:hypothetical protein
MEGSEEANTGAVVRLSPAGDGAGWVEETCEKKAGATWWMNVLVGGSAQHFLRGRLELARGASLDSCPPRPPAARAIRAPGPLPAACTQNAHCSGRAPGRARSAASSTVFFTL